MNLIMHGYRLKNITFIFLILLLIGCNNFTPSENTKASIIFYNGNIITVDENFNIYDSVAISGNKIIDVGSFKDIKQYIGGKTKIFNLKKKTLLPGFIDSHIHFLATLNSSKYINLKPDKIKTLNDLLIKVKEKAKKLNNDSWIIGFGWDQSKIKWNKNREFKWPTKNDLDKVSPNNPVILYRVGGHTAVVNSKALKIAGITKHTPEPRGGLIVRFKNNQLTGILKEKAIEMVAKYVPKYNFTQEEFKKFTFLALSKGLTNIEEANLDLDGLNIYKEAYDKDLLNLRVNVLLESKYLDWLAKNNIKTPFNLRDRFIRICGLKFFADGTLGSKTAALKKPYNNDKNNFGLLLHNLEYFENKFTKAHRLGIQTATHAIGDLAIETVLKANKASYVKLNKHIGEHRDRIEHAIVLNNKLINMFKEENLIAAIQFSFWSSDKDWAKERLGNKRLKYAYPWKILLKKGVFVSGGTDSPVETLDPLTNIENIVVDSGVSIKDAIIMYTRNSAYASFQEKYLGQIKKGYTADLIILSKNILETKRKNISKIKVLFTMVNGDIKYNNLF